MFRSYHNITECCYVDNSYISLHSMEIFEEEKVSDVVDNILNRSPLQDDVKNILKVLITKNFLFYYNTIWNEYGDDAIFSKEIGWNLSFKGFKGNLELGLCILMENISYIIMVF